MPNNRIYIIIQVNLAKELTQKLENIAGGYTKNNPIHSKRLIKVNLSIVDNVWFIFAKHCL